MGGIVGWAFGAVAGNTGWTAIVLALLLFGQTARGLVGWWNERGERAERGRVVAERDAAKAELGTERLRTARMTAEAKGAREDFARASEAIMAEKRAREAAEAKATEARRLLNEQRNADGRAREKLNDELGKARADRGTSRDREVSPVLRDAFGDGGLRDGPASEPAAGGRGPAASRAPPAASRAGPAARP